MIKKITILLSIGLILAAFTFKDTLVRSYQSIMMYQKSKQRAKIYVLDKVHSIEDITKKLIAEKDSPVELKKPLINNERRIVIFKYLSGTEQVAGYYSYLINGEHPTIIFLRGGNGNFGIMRPNNRFSFLNNYNVVGTLYRGNVYGGKDEFGGDDIDDVENLIKFFPKISAFTHKKIQAPYIMMGGSRGAMQMFISIARSQYVKTKISHAISVSGNLDLSVSLKYRYDMKYLFNKKFKASRYTSLEEWIKYRNPVDNVEYLPKSLKTLLIYGLSDNRVSIEEQINLLNALKKAGLKTKFIKINGATHGFNEHFNEHFNDIQVEFNKFMRGNF